MLKLEHLVKHYQVGAADLIRAIDGVSLTVGAGELKQGAGEVRRGGEPVPAAYQAWPAPQWGQLTVVDTGARNW